MNKPSNKKPHLWEGNVGKAFSLIYAADTVRGNEELLWDVDWLRATEPSNSRRVYEQWLLVDKQLDRLARDEVIKEIREQNYTDESSDSK